MNHVHDQSDGGSGSHCRSHDTGYAALGKAPGRKRTEGGGANEWIYTRDTPVTSGCFDMLHIMQDLVAHPAGGLDPDLQPGDCIVASAILSGNSRMPTDPAWSQNLIDTVPNATLGLLAGVPVPVATAQAKRALHQKTGAVAVDMESHIVASVAQKHAIPMAAIRVITDPAGRALPKSALAAMRPDGTTDFAAMMHHLFKNPWELPTILRTALDARAARATLMRGRQLLGPRLGLPDFQRLELDVVA